MLVVRQRGRLLGMDVFVSDHLHEAVFDARIQIPRRIFRTHGFGCGLDAVAKTRNCERPATGDRSAAIEDRAFFNPFGFYVAMFPLRWRPLSRRLPAIDECDALI
jgi:hypothetical protein